VPVELSFRGKRGDAHIHISSFDTTGTARHYAARFMIIAEVSSVVTLFYFSDG
jgi:hypothetical protein